MKRESIQEAKTNLCYIDYIIEYDYMILRCMKALTLLLIF